MPPEPSLCSSLYWPICWASIAAFWASRRERASRRVNTKMAAALIASSANSPQNVHRRIDQRAKRFGVVDFGDDADVAVGQPFPGADDRHAAVVAIALDIHARPPGDGFGRGIA